MELSRCLAKLHDQGYVHGDVRLQNIVFTENDSVLIDFDLAKKVGKAYPTGYNESYEERHTDAIRRGKMLKSHDIHSVLYLMEKYAECKFEKEFVMEMQTEFRQIDERKVRRTAGKKRFKEERPPVQWLEEKLAGILKKILTDLDDF